MSTKTLATALAVTILSMPGIAAADVQAPVTLAPTPAQSATTPPREDGYIVSVSSRAGGEDRSNPANPVWRPELQTETTDVFARYVSAGGRTPFTEFRSHLKLGPGNIDLPVGIKRVGLWTPPGPGSYRFGKRAWGNKAAVDETCAWHGSIAGVDAYKSQFAYRTGLDAPPIESGAALTLDGKEVPIAGWESCVATQGGRPDRDLDRLHWEGYKDSHGAITASPDDLMGMEAETVYSKDGGPWLSLTGVQHDPKDDPSSLAPVAPSSANPFSDPTKFASGWVVEGWKPKLTPREGYDASRSAQWLGEDDRYPSEFTLPMTVTGKSTWSSLAQVRAKIGEARPYLFKSASTQAVTETGTYTYAILFPRANQQAAWPLRCGARLTVNGQEVFGPQGSVDESQGNGVGLIIGTANFAATGGYPAILRWGCAFSKTGPDANNYSEQVDGLHLNGDGTFAAGEEGVNPVLVIRGPHGEAFSPPSTGQFFVQLTK